MEAAWDPEQGVALVVQHKGKVLSTMGVTVQGQLALFPEEVLFLLQRHNLRLVDGEGEPVSTNTFLVQTSRHPLHDPMTAPTYLYLKERDFVVRRFGIPPRLSSLANTLACAHTPQTAESSTKIRFSVYGPTVTSRTQLPRSPLFHVALSSYNHDIPGPDTLDALFETTNDSTTILLAVAGDDRSILFFQMTNLTPATPIPALEMQDPVPPV